MALRGLEETVSLRKKIKKNLDSRNSLPYHEPWKTERLSGSDGDTTEAENPRHLGSTGQAVRVFALLVEILRGVASLQIASPFARAAAEGLPVRQPQMAGPATNRSRQKGGNHRIGRLDIWERWQMIQIQLEW